MNCTGEIDVLPLLAQIDFELIQLLKGLDVEEWHFPTVSPKWNVKDIAVHLLDGNLRTLSMLRDGYFSPEQSPNAYKSIIEYLNALNADWVQAMKRLSPNMIVDLLESSGKEYIAYLNTLDPDKDAVFSVGWAGEARSKNWFHIAREYTEKWHHQQQIRKAVGKQDLLMTDYWFIPYLETSIRALPYHFGKINAEEDGSVQLEFVGAQKSHKCNLLNGESWGFVDDLLESPSVLIRVPLDISWLIFTKGIKKGEAIEQSEIIGDQRLGRHFFDLIAIMG